MMNPLPTTAYHCTMVHLELWVLRQEIASGDLDPALESWRGWNIIDQARHYLDWSRE